MKLKIISGDVEHPKVLSFFCEGCNEEHSVWVNGYKHPNSTAWGWNGSMDTPTFTPSILIKSGHYATYFKEGDSCWCTYNTKHADDPSSFVCVVCHTYITNGKIEYLPDSTHHLSGQIINLSEIS